MDNLTVTEMQAALDYAVNRVRDLESELAAEKRNYRDLHNRHDVMMVNLIGMPEGAALHVESPDYTTGPIGEAYVAGHVAAQMGMEHLQQQQEYLGRVCTVLESTCKRQHARIVELEAKLGTPEAHPGTPGGVE